MAQFAASRRPSASSRDSQQTWYRITNHADTGAVEVYLYDEIGLWGITAQAFVDELRTVTASQIDLHVNSPGGEIFDGIAIYHCLRGHAAKVTTYVDSLAASAASFIAMAGDEIIIRPHSQMMIHEGQGVCLGDAKDMRELADLLDKLSNNIASIYAKRAGGTVAEWRERMRDETWYSAKEAVKAGLADRVEDFKPAAADAEATNTWDLSIFTYAGRDAAPAPDAVAEHFVGEQGPEIVVLPPGTPIPTGPDTPEPDDAPPPVDDAHLGDWDPAAFTTAIVAAVGPDPYFDPDLFRAAVSLAANDVPAPDQATTPAPPADDPSAFAIDPHEFKRALREATL